MKFELKRLSPEALTRALEKAHLYRLLNEPAEAESICRDILDVDPEHQDALVTLLLALTDQFDKNAVSAVGEARRVIERVTNPYAHVYYAGIVFERRAKALYHSVPGAGSRAYEWLREAMTWYEKAERLRPAGNDDALLRWNACARLLMDDHRLVPAIEERGEPHFLE